MRSQSRWLRLYAEVYRDPKVARLSDGLFRFWINCLCLAAENDGALPSMEDTAFYLRVSVQEAEVRIEELSAAGLLDETGKDRFTPHNWNGRQYQSDVSTERVREFRKRSRNGHETLHKTQPETSVAVTETTPDTDTDTEQTQKQSRADTDRRKAVCADLDGQTSNKFPTFWERWPLKQRRDEAARAWVSLVTVDTESEVFSCLSRFLASDQAGRGVVGYAHNWLQQQRRDNWRGDWPTAKSEPRRMSVTEQAIAEVENARRSR